MGEWCVGLHVVDIFRIKNSLFMYVQVAVKVASGGTTLVKVDSIFVRAFFFANAWWINWMRSIGFPWVAKILSQ